jgi:tryptophan synthase alpha chain
VIASQTQPSARITQAFAAARAESRGVLIPYLVAGDPDVETTLATLTAITRAGADIIELGIPYSDPIADGPTIAAAAKRALDHGITVDAVLETARRAQEGGAAPILFFSYLNPILQYGLERFAQRAQEVGACGAIVPDVPLEEIGPIREAFARFGLALPLLIAPTTPFERAVRIAQTSEGFVYVVSRLGVTGAKREPDFAWIAERVKQLRAQTSLPLAVGFGIATPAHVSAVLEHADAAIVGSALVDVMAAVAPERVPSAVAARVAELAAVLSR